MPLIKVTAPNLMDLLITIFAVACPQRLIQIVSIVLDRFSSRSWTQLKDRSLKNRSIEPLFFQLNLSPLLTLSLFKSFSISIRKTLLLYQKILVVCNYYETIVTEKGFLFSVVFCTFTLKFKSDFISNFENIQTQESNLLFV